MPGFTHQLLALIGGGGHARVVADAASMRGLKIAGVLDDQPSPALGAGTRLGNLRDFGRLTAPAIVAVGDLPLRRALIAEADAARVGWAPALVHPSAVIAPSAAADAPGVFIAPRAVVNPEAVIGPHAIINTGAIIEHECKIGHNTHVAPGAVLGGCVRVGADTLVGLGAIILPGIRIGAGCTIGAGALVREDVEDGVTVVGVPARVVCGNLRV